MAPVIDSPPDVAEGAEEAAEIVAVHLGVDRRPAHSVRDQPRAAAAGLVAFPPHVEGRNPGSSGVGLGNDVDRPQFMVAQLALRAGESNRGQRRRVRRGARVGIRGVFPLVVHGHDEPVHVDEDGLRSGGNPYLAEDVRADEGGGPGGRGIDLRVDARGPEGNSECIELLHLEVHPPQRGESGRGGGSRDFRRLCPGAEQAHPPAQGQAGQGTAQAHARSVGQLRLAAADAEASPFQSRALQAAVPQREHRRQQLTVARAQGARSLAAQLEPDIEIDGVRGGLGQGRGEVDACAPQIRGDAHGGEHFMVVAVLLHVEDASPTRLAGKPGQPGGTFRIRFLQQSRVAKVRGEVLARGGALDFYPNPPFGVRRRDLQGDRAAEVDGPDILGVDRRAFEVECACHPLETLLEAGRVHLVVPDLEPPGHPLLPLGRSERYGNLQSEGGGALRTHRVQHVDETWRERAVAQVCRGLFGGAGEMPVYPECRAAAFHVGNVHGGAAYPGALYPALAELDLRVSAFEAQLRRQIPDGGPSGCVAQLHPRDPGAGAHASLSFVEGPVAQRPLDSQLAFLEVPTVNGPLDPRAQVGGKHSHRQVHRQVREFRACEGQPDSHRGLPIDSGPLQAALEGSRNVCGLERRLAQVHVREVAVPPPVGRAREGRHGHRLAEHLVPRPVE